MWVMLIKVQAALRKTWIPKSNEEAEALNHRKIIILKSNNVDEGKRVLGLKCLQKKFHSKAKNLPKNRLILQSNFTIIVVAIMSVNSNNVMNMKIAAHTSTSEQRLLTLLILMVAVQTPLTKNWFKNISSLSKD